MWYNDSDRTDATSTMMTPFRIPFGRLACSAVQWPKGQPIGLGVVSTTSRVSADRCNELLLTTKRGGRRGLIIMRGVFDDSDESEVNAFTALSGSVNGDQKAQRLLVIVVEL